MSITRATKIIGTQMAIGATYGSILFHYFWSQHIPYLEDSLGSFQQLAWLVIRHDSSRNAQKWGPQTRIILVSANNCDWCLRNYWFFCSYFPARNAAAISPAEALRQES